MSSFQWAGPKHVEVLAKVQVSDRDNGLYTILVDTRDPVPGFRYCVTTYWNSAACWNSGNYCGTLGEALEEYHKTAREEFDRVMREDTGWLSHEWAQSVREKLEHA